MPTRWFNVPVNKGSLKGIIFTSNRRPTKYFPKTILKHDRAALSRRVYKFKVEEYLSAGFKAQRKHHKKNQALLKLEQDWRPSVG